MVVVCEVGGDSSGAELSNRETAVAPEWGTAPIREDGSQKGPPMGTFPVLQPQGEGQDKEDLGLGPSSGSGVD